MRAFAILILSLAAAVACDKGSDGGSDAGQTTQEQGGAGDPAPENPAAPAPPAPQPPANPPAPPVGAGTLSLDLSGGVALGLVAPSMGLTGNLAGEGPQGLVKVAADGTVTAVGDAQVAGFYVAPNKKVYLTFERPVDVPAIDGAALTDASQKCVLVEADPAVTNPDGSTKISCVDGELLRVEMFQDHPIQFDNDGAIYYEGQVAVQSGAILRKRSPDNTKKDLTNNNIELERFDVLPSGSVALVGKPVGGNSNEWFMRFVNPMGGLKTVDSSGEYTFPLGIFPDGKFYYVRSNGGIYRVDPSTGALDEKAWIARDLDTEIAATAHHVADKYAYFHGSDYRTAQTSDDRVFITGTYSGASGATTQLYQVYPTFKRYELGSLKKFQGLQLVSGDRLLVTGVNAQNTQKLVLVDVSGDTPVETDLLPDDEVEVYQLQFSAALGKVLFHGLRFADNTLVVGQVVLPGGSSAAGATMTPATAKFSSFQSL